MSPRPGHAPYRCCLVALFALALAGASSEAHEKKPRPPSGPSRLRKSLPPDTLVLSPSRRLEHLAGGVTFAQQTVITGLKELFRWALPAPKAGTPYAFWIGSGGDLDEGYLMALMADGGARLVAARFEGPAHRRLGPRHVVSRALTWIAEHPHQLNLAAGLLSCLGIVFFETHAVLNDPVLADIPAGLAGAALRTGVRAYGLKQAERAARAALPKRDPRRTGKVRLREDSPDAAAKDLLFGAFLSL
ncbi:MAG: hypothetical protein IT371_04690 [Deltaproteobacteria bacterium]|nr:hypothetical protein [Deltaproteobacteria bacterium]